MHFRKLFHKTIRRVKQLSSLKLNKFSINTINEDSVEIYFNFMPLFFNILKKLTNIPFTNFIMVLLIEN